MALYRGCTKVSGIGQSFNPENTGTEGQVLTKTNSGYAYCDPQGGDNGPMVDVLVVAGGGGGSYGGGGGGAVEDCRKFPLGDVTTFAITIGAGGNSACSRYYTGCNGGDSCFLNIVAYGGGGGGKSGGGGTAGGNGGGGGTSSNGGMIGGIGKQGFSGGKGGIGGGGGGGGAGGPGLASIHYYDNNSLAYGGVGGQGGQGYYNSFWSECLYGSGGGGGGKVVGDNAFSGGGNGGCQLGTSATYYGGGGGGSGEYSCCGGNGCQGIVIVKYKTDGSCGFTTATGGTVTTDGDYTVHTFTSDGTFCITG